MHHIPPAGRMRRGAREAGCRNPTAAAATRLLVLASAMLRPGHARRTPGYAISGDRVLDAGTRDSKPGSPALPGPGGGDLPVSNPTLLEPWRADLGMRLIQAARAHDAMEKCESFLSFGDFTWCKRAMPQELNPAYKRQYEHIHEYSASNGTGIVRPPSAEALLALSFGIEGGDCWSEIMSGLYFLKTELFDCYFAGAEGPMPNDLHAGFSRRRPCTTRRCYTEEYKAHQVCLDDTSGVQEFVDEGNRRYQSLRRSLEGRAPLSTFLKLDVEGSEWGALEWLLDNEEEMAKIRTLDMEIHLNMDPKVSEADMGKVVNVTFTHESPNRETLTRHVEILERLARKFAVTGSTLEAKLSKAALDYRSKRAKDGHYAGFPAYVATDSGLSLDQYCISFVNPELLKS